MSDNPSTRPAEPAASGRRSPEDYDAEHAEILADHRGVDRRTLIRRVGVVAMATAAFGGTMARLNVEPEVAVAAAACGPGGAKLTMLGSNGGLTVDWYAEGKTTMEHWAGVLGVDLTWIDGELNGVAQRAKLDTAATRKWDIAGITAAETGTVVDPVRRIADAGTGVFQMTSSIGGPNDQLPLLSFIHQSSYDMGLLVGRALFDKVGGTGTVIQTQGPSADSGARDRDRGFKAALAQYPGMTLLADDFGNWDKGRTRQLWDTYLTKFPQITCAYFQNDSMAFAGLEAMRAAGRNDIAVGGTDAMPDAVAAVQDGRFVATIRHSSCQIHALAVILGVAWKQGAITEFPAETIVTAPLVTRENAASVVMLQQAGVSWA